MEYTKKRVYKSSLFAKKVKKYSDIGYIEGKIQAFSRKNLRLSRNLRRKGDTSQVFSANFRGFFGSFRME